MKNKEALKKEIKEKMSREIDAYIDQMDKGFQGDHFDIGEMEKLWGNAIEGCEVALKDGLEEMLNTAVEKEIVEKKKQN